MKKRSLSILLTLALLISMIPFTAIPAFAYEGDEYFTFREWDGTEVISFDDVPLSDFEPLTEITDTTSVLGSGWYVVKGENVVISDSLTINGTAGNIDNATNIILMDGACLTVQKGINIQYGNSLIIYGQRNDSGRLVAYGENNGAAIGGSGSFGSLTVNGGTVEATGNTYGTGIGGGYNGDGGTVVINGGKVIAKGYGGAGIGSGGNAWSSGGTVDIHGGIVEASSERGGAAIGGGSGGNGANVTITGGTVTATSCNAAIGGGAGASSHGSLSIYKDAYIMSGSEAPGTHVGLEQYINSRDAYISVNAPNEEGHTYAWSVFFDKENNTCTLANTCEMCGKVKQSCTRDLTGYIAVDYIDVMGGAYINTGYLPTNNTHVAMDVTVNGDNEYWFGARTSYHGTEYAVTLRNSVTGVYAGYMKNSSTDNLGAVSPGRHRVELNKNKVFIDGVERTSFNYAYDENALTIDESLYLFGEHQVGWDKTLSGQKSSCYGCEIYDSGELKHYYIPCVYANSAGLYDLVEEKFYGNWKKEGQITPYSENRIKIKSKAATCTEDGWDAYYFSGSNLYADADCMQEITDLKTWSGYHPALGHDWEMTDRDNHTCANCKQVAQHTDENNDGYCDSCSFDFRATTGWNIPYLIKTVDEETGKVTTEEVRFTGSARGVAQAGTAWGNIGSDTWLVLDEDITLDYRPEVKGNVHLILLNGKTLTADQGITVEEDNSLIIYAQSEDKATTGTLSIKAPNGETAMGGRKGKNGEGSEWFYGIPGQAGYNSGKICLFGGKIVFESQNAPCIGGGNGGNGANGEPNDGGDPVDGGSGGNGGACGPVCIYGGSIALKGINAPCIGGGNGGTGGRGCGGNIGRGGNVGNGGTGGNVQEIYFYDGACSFESTGSACVSGGNGGTGGNNGSNGGNGKINFYGSCTAFHSTTTACLSKDTLTIQGTPAMKAGEDADHAQPVNGYDNQKYFSVTYIPGENGNDPINPFKPGEHTHHGSPQSGVTPSGKTVTYYKCDCGKLFEDSACTKEITDLNAWLAKGGNGDSALSGGDKTGTKSQGGGLQTRDTSNMILWIILMLVSAMGFVSYFALGKRKGNMK